jgi:hypothetical protein
VHSFVLIALLWAAPDAGTDAAVAVYRVVQEACEPCRPEDFAQEEQGARDCGVFHAPLLAPDVARCIQRALAHKRPFHARFEYRDLRGDIAVQTYGRAADGGLWFHQYTSDDGTDEPCHAVVNARECKTLHVSAPDEKPFVQCVSEPGKSQTICAEAEQPRLALGEPLPVTDLRCSASEDGIYSDCLPDGGADVVPGANLVCLEREHGLRCGAVEGFDKRSSVPPRCRKPDAGPPACLGVPYDEAAARLSSDNL